ncbi:MAG: hypothetical protein QNL04_06590 [SAR324 cluster bacterium]|nr:hypothetical protein [SAR324 cluster bacterium]
MPKGLGTKEGRLNRLQEAEARLKGEEESAIKAQVDKIKQRTKEEQETGKKNEAPNQNSLRRLWMLIKRRILLILRAGL